MPKLGFIGRQFVRLFAGFLLVGSASAGLFDDDEARRAILDLRQKMETLRRENDQKLLDESKRQAEEIASLRRGLLDLQNQWEASNGEAAKIRGQGEQLGRDMSEARRFLADAPWMFLAPTAIIAICVLSINFMGDGLRDALDPRAWRTRRSAGADA